MNFSNPFLHLENSNSSLVAYICDLVVKPILAFERLIHIFYSFIHAFDIITASPTLIKFLSRYWKKYGECNHKTNDLEISSKWQTKGALLWKRPNPAGTHLREPARGNRQSKTLNWKILSDPQKGGKDSRFCEHNHYLKNHG